MKTIKSSKKLVYNEINIKILKKISNLCLKLLNFTNKLNPPKKYYFIKKIHEKNEKYQGNFPNGCEAMISPHQRTRNALLERNREEILCE